MLRSMTGFVTKTIEITNKLGDKGFVTINLRSLNARFFEAICKLPPAIQNMEVDIISALKKSLIRAKVNLVMSCSNPNLFKSPMQVSNTMLQHYLDAFNYIQQHWHITGTLQMSDIIKLPDIFIAEDISADSMKDPILQAITQCIEALIQQQEKEGMSLLHDLLKRCSILQEKIDQISSIAKKVFAQKKEEFENKLATYHIDVANPQYGQLLLDLEKIDIHEELVRFNSHLAHLQEIVQSPAIEKGRQIDFILQELSREINTLGAKCADSDISSLVISIKVELEKIREQGQNIV